MSDPPGTEIAAARRGLYVFRFDPVNELVAGDGVVEAEGRPRVHATAGINRRLGQ